MATTSEIHSMREKYPGKSDPQAARLYALLYGFVAVIRYKSEPTASDFTNIACCQFEDQVGEVLGSRYCHEAERICDSRTDPDFDGCWGERKDREVITSPEVATSKRPILFVVHRIHKTWVVADQPWERIKDALVVPKVQITRLDPSVEEVTDLPAGWLARRTSKDAPWERISEFEFEKGSQGGGEAKPQPAKILIGSGTSQKKWWEIWK